MALPKPPPSSSPLWKAFGVLTAAHTKVFELSGGRVGGRIGSLRMLLLHHVGRRSGVERTTPLLYIADGEDLVLVASKGGVDQHPAWYHNVMAADEVSVQVGGERRRVRPRRATAEERARLWPRVVATYRPYESYQRHTTREIPLVILQPAR